ncbi:MAG: LysR family transcriptional regulator [Alphaproteobacteria bacterium]|nr:MAG: LysR family transcriptional regulator [Alphaproteobacteria bacterium]
MDWDRLRIFHTVAEAGSFTAAARTLGLSQSAVSRQIRALEDSLHVALFNRHARGLALTHEGEYLFRVASDVVERLAHAEETLLEARDAPRGRLVVTTMISFGATWLTPHLKDFIRRYPEIELVLNLSDEDLDLATRAADVAIRFQAPQQADLIQRPLVTVRHHIYAAPAYLQRKGAPATIADLDTHDIIVYGPTAPPSIKDINWTLSIGREGRRPRKPVLQVNNTYAVLQAIEAGIGLAAIPDYLAAHDRSLVRVLPEIEGPAFETYFVYPKELRGAKRVRLFYDYLREQVRAAVTVLDRV